MKYILIFHANLNYAYLPEVKYEFVIRNSYELIIDTMSEYLDTEFVFEASGYTIEQIAIKTPDVLEKLKVAIESGKCEFMGSPYSHPMLANFPKEDGIWSLEFAKEVYQKHLGIQPKSFWNPECGWCDYIPEQITKSGYQNILGDFEAYSRSLNCKGRPFRPEIHDVERTNQYGFYNFDYKYDLPGDEPSIHFPFENLENSNISSLRVFLRTDRIAQFGVRYFMGMPGYTFEKYLALIDKYSQQPANESEGALIIFADDAEYIGTNAWYELAYKNNPDQVFEYTADSKSKLQRLISACQKRGSFTSFAKACHELPTIKEAINFDNDSAWHGAKASSWADTPLAKLLRPWQDGIRKKLNTSKGIDKSLKRRIWYHLTNSYNSDGQWPPTLPEAPHFVFPENYRYCFDNLMTADQLIGGVDKTSLKTEPASALKEIFTPQQDILLKKIRLLMENGGITEKENAQLAKKLIEISKDISSLKDSGTKILYPSEYEVRANALSEARNLVGGILINEEHYLLKME